MTKLFIVVCVFILLLPLSALTQQGVRSPDPELLRFLLPSGTAEVSSLVSDTVLNEVGRWPRGLCYAVDAKEEYMYLGNGPSFQIVDISNPDLPEVVGEFLTQFSFIRDIQVRDSLAFVITGGLLILNITNPSSPQAIGYIQTSPVPLRVAIADSFAFVSTFSGAIQVVDISDPTFPRLRGGTIVEEWPYCLAVRGRFAYAAGLGDPWLHIIDANNPDSLATAELDIGGTPTCAFVMDTLLLLGMNTFSGDRQVKAFSISTPDSPTFLGATQAISRSDGITSITGVANRAYFSTLHDTICSVDITNLYVPRITARVGSPVPLFGGNAISTVESMVLTAFAGKVWLVDGSDPDSLVPRYSFASGGWAEKVAAKDSLLFVASEFAGLWILNVSTPNQPREIANINSFGLVLDVVADSSFVYVVSSGLSPGDSLRGVWIMDVSDPHQPRVLGHHAGITSNTAEPPSIVKFRDLIFRSENGTPSTLEVIDISNPTQPIQLSVFQRAYYTRDIAVRDSIAYWTTNGSGMRIINYRNPYSPVEISPFGLSTPFSRLAIQDSFAYVNTSNTLTALSIADPYSVHPIDTLSGSYDTPELYACSEYLYAANGFVLDIRNPLELREVGRRVTRDAQGVAAKAGFVFFAEGSSGVSICRNQLITSVSRDQHIPVPRVAELYQNFPNPFNPITHMRYDLPVAAFVTLKIYNIMGQEVSVLVNEAKPAGTHEVTWSGERFPSGVYFCRLSVGAFTKTTKLVLVR